MHNYIFFFWKGCAVGNLEFARGVNFAVKSNLVRNLIEMPNGVNERELSRFKTKLKPKYYHDIGICTDVGCKQF